MDDKPGVEGTPFKVNLNLDQFTLGVDFILLEEPIPADDGYILTVQILSEDMRKTLGIK